MPSECIWHKGPPPHVGWWNAGRWRSRRVWRWWDGAGWSDAVGSGCSAKSAGAIAASGFVYGDDTIEWSDYWPENARVPRIDPRKEPSNAQ